MNLLEEVNAQVEQNRIEAEATEIAVNLTKKYAERCISYEAAAGRTIRTIEPSDTRVYISFTDNTYISYQSDPQDCCYDSPRMSLESLYRHGIMSAEDWDKYHASQNAAYGVEEQRRARAQLLQAAEKLGVEEARKVLGL
jgi:hypothetical protein